MKKIQNQPLVVLLLLLTQLLLLLTQLLQLTQQLLIVLLLLLLLLLEDLGKPNCTTCTCATSHSVPREFEKHFSSAGDNLPHPSTVSGALTSATAASGHVAATASSCRPVLLKPCSATKLSVERLFTKWKVGP